MSEFTPIETQEQLDKVVGDRIRRAEAKAAEKFGDYEAIKAKNAEYAQQVAQLQETISKNTASLEDLTKKVQSYETASVKTKVALEIGLPYQMAGRLSGTTEEEIRADAKSMMDLIGTQTPRAPLGSGEPVHSNKANEKEAIWANFAAQLGNE